MCVCVCVCVCVWVVYLHCLIDTPPPPTHTRNSHTLQHKAVQTDPKNAVLLSELAKSLFELAMLQNREEAQETLKEALEVRMCVH